MTENKREKYEPPAVQRVLFAPGEVASGACKRAPGTGQNRYKCARGHNQFVSVNFGS